MSLTTHIEALGSKAAGAGRAGSRLAIIAAKSMSGVFARDSPKGEVARQMYIVGNKSVLFIAITMGFLGMVMVIQSGGQINRVTGDLSQLGPQFLKLFIQEFAPTITALMLATRVGAGIAAEVGSMKVTEQIDALRLSGITPTSYLIAPRLIACLFMGFVLTVIAIVIAFSAGGVSAWGVFGLNPTVFFDSSMVRSYDIAIGSIKTICYSTAIPIISGYCGLEARGGSEGVGTATTSAVIGSSFAVLLLDFIISGIGLTIFGGGV
ncbi:MAG: ABC transporter permease [Myxococcales bacterium]|nr:ABC transporter permease [Myxococcales bacterium]